MTVLSHTAASFPFYLPGGHMTDEEFYRFCTMNPGLRIEQDAEKKIHILPPTNSDTGNKNARLLIQIGIWNQDHGLGELFDSSTGFQLPNGAFRSPDIAWIKKERWLEVSEIDRMRFAPIAPDFVVELRSPDQSLTELKNKMDEYLANGCKLGWLIDPQNQQTFIYQADNQLEKVQFDEPLVSDKLLPGLSLRLSEVFAQ